MLYGCSSQDDEVLASNLYNQGVGHYSGQYDFDINPEKGCDLFLQAAALGSAEAAFALSDCYRTGLGREYSVEQFEHWSLRAIDLGSTGAKLMLGARYLYDSSELRKASEGVKILESVGKEDRQGVAAFNLGIAYWKGIGVSASAQIAFSYFEYSAKQEHLLGIAMMARIYKEGMLGKQPNQDFATEYLDKISLMNEQSTNPWMPKSLSVTYLEAIKGIDELTEQSRSDSN